MSSAAPDIRDSPAPPIRLFHGRADRPIRLFDPAAGWASSGGFLGILPRALAPPIPLPDGAGDTRLLVAAVERALDAGVAQGDGTTFDYILNGLQRATGAPAAALPTARALDAAHRIAHRTGVLTLRDSAALAQRALAAAAGPLPSGTSLAAVREGHTACVWRAELPDPSGTPHRLCLLVPRDREAEAEQLASMSTLAAIRGVAPRDVIGSERRLAVAAPDRIGGEVIVLQTEWLDRALEINVVEDETGRPALVAVRTFEGRAGTGTRLDEGDADDAMAAMRAIVLAGTVTLPGGRFVVPSLEVNDGDFVLHGGRVRVVAASPPAPAMTAAQVIAAIAAFGGRSVEYGRRLPIGDPDRLARELTAAFPPDALRDAARAMLRDPATGPRARLVAAALPTLARNRPDRAARGV